MANHGRHLLTSYSQNPVVMTAETLKRRLESRVPWMMRSGVASYLILLAVQSSVVKLTWLDPVTDLVSEHENARSIVAESQASHCMLETHQEGVLESAVYVTLMGKVRCCAT